jgi:metal-responsive CopG/Arc/MetJ family transcriptional regulator
MKVAISLPDPVFDAAERLAEEMRVSRSQLYAQALASYLDSHGAAAVGAAAVTARLNDVYAKASSEIDPALAAAQLASVEDEAW